MLSNVVVPPRIELGFNDYESSTLPLCYRTLVQEVRFELRQWECHVLPLHYDRVVVVLL